MKAFDEAKDKVVQSSCAFINMDKHFDFHFVRRGVGNQFPENHICECGMSPKCKRSGMGNQRMKEFSLHHVLLLIQSRMHT